MTQINDEVDVRFHGKVTYRGESHGHVWWRVEANGTTYWFPEEAIEHG